VLLFGGVGLAVQTLVAQAYGAHRSRRHRGRLDGLVGVVVHGPLFTVLSLGGAWIFAPFDIPPETLRLALDYWFPRMLGGPLAIALWSLLGFFNGIGRPTITLWVTLSVAVAMPC
jgi:MATE family multidrug resistance protein